MLLDLFRIHCIPWHIHHFDDSFPSHARFFVTWTAAFMEMWCITLTFSQYFIVHCYLDILYLYCVMNCGGTMQQGIGEKKRNLLDIYHSTIWLSLSQWTVINLRILHIYKYHDDVIKWKTFPCYWPFLWGIHWWLVNSPHKGQWRRAFIFSLICTWMNSWVNNREAGDLRYQYAHYDITVM